MFAGLYNGKQAHVADLAHVLERAQRGGVEGIMITAGQLQDLVHAFPIIQQYSSSGLALCTTIGVHPTRAEPDGVSQVDKLRQAYQDMSGEQRSLIAAVGELGLDYERIQFSSKEAQSVVLKKQLEVLCPLVQRPLFLHCRGAVDDLVATLVEHASAVSLCKTGVFHSFDGDASDARKILDCTAAKFYIGLNGCSLRNEQTLDALHVIPLDRILFETDAPWCEMKATHASAKYVSDDTISGMLGPARKKEKWDAEHRVKGRNEPSHILQVCECVSKVLGLRMEDVAEAVYSNTIECFPHFANR
jgi:TatD DNase family protein